MKSDEEGSVRTALHTDKTLRMHVVATKTATGDFPQPKIVFHDSYTLDLAQPQPWRGQHSDNYGDWDFRIKFLVNLSPEGRKFYPPEQLDYLRIDLAAWAWLDRADMSEPITQQFWIGVGAPYAGCVLQVGPIAGLELFCTFNLKFENS